MSSLHENSRATARGTDTVSATDTTQDKSEGQAAGADAARSYSTHFHLNYVTTFHQAQNRVEEETSHHIVYSCRPGAGTSSSVPQAPASLTCQIGVEDQRHELRLHLHAGAGACSGAGLASTDDARHRPVEPASAEDASKSEREQRTAVLNEMFGIWKDRTDIPDGLQFQQAMREEWR